MLEGDGSHGPERRDEGHDRWLAMQSAYAEYRNASEAFERTLQFSDDSTASERIRLDTLERQQRVAFGHYLEARMEFLEFQLDKSNLSDTGPVAPPKHETEDSGVSYWWAFANCTPVLQLLVIILLCMTAFSLIREQKYLRDLDATRNEAWATRNLTRDRAQPYGQKLDNGTALQQSAIRQVGHTLPAPALPRPAATSQAAARKPPAERQLRHQPALRIHPKQASAMRELVPEPQSKRIGTRNYYSFSLTRSPQFKRVGPISVSLWSVDSQRRYVSLSIHSNSMQIDVRRLQLNQPVWINAGYNEQPLELVADRLTGNRLDGHLVEPQNNKSELRASGFRSMPPERP